MSEPETPEAEASPASEGEASPAAASSPRPWRSRHWAPFRVLRAVAVLLLGVVVVAPNLPSDRFGEWTSDLAARLREYSFVQSWRMYSPNPQRAQTYMNLTAYYEDGSQAPLEETLQEHDGWSGHFAWDKTRVDIWRYYANMHPKRNNEHRTWYLRGVCVREARRGKMPDKIVMEHVTRRFAPPDRVAAGYGGLGRPQRRLVTVQYCKTQVMRPILEADPVPHPS